MNKRLSLTFLVALTAGICVCLARAGGNQTDNLSPTGQPVKKLREEVLIAAESRLWEALKAKDEAALSSLIARDAMMVDLRGSLSPPEFLRSLADLSLVDYSLSDVKVTRISKGAALVTYQARGRVLRRGQESASPPHYNATIWGKRGGKWLIIFHQSTPALLQAFKAS